MTQEWTYEEVYYRWDDEPHRIAAVEHRLNGKLVVINDPVAAEKVLLPGQMGNWSHWQVSKLIELDLLAETDEPVRLPERKIEKPVANNSLDHNFVHQDWMRIPFTWMTDALFDGEPPVGYRFTTFDDKATMAHIMFSAGVFKSIGEARRNGWDKPIPLGFSDYIVGKRKIGINVLNFPQCPNVFCRCGNNRGFNGVCPWKT